MTPSPAALAKLHRSLEDSVGPANVRDDAGMLVTYATDSTPVDHRDPVGVEGGRAPQQVGQRMAAGERHRRLEFHGAYHISGARSGSDEHTAVTG